MIRTSLEEKRLFNWCLARADEASVSKNPAVRQVYESFNFSSRKPPFRAISEFNLIVPVGRNMASNSCIVELTVFWRFL